MSLPRNPEHEWEHSTDEYDLRCESCGKPWNYKWGEPPEKWCDKLQKSRLSPVSDNRQKRRTNADGEKVVYGPEFERVSKLSCCVCSQPSGPAHHVKTVGAGGKDKNNVVPLCPKHHQEVHTIGQKSFEEKHSVDLKEVAKNV